MAHHPIVQKVVGELLVKGATKASTCGIAFYSNVSVVPRCTSGLQPIYNLQ